MTGEYKIWIVNELKNWAETFNNSYPEHMEEEIEDEENGFKYIHSLIENFSKDNCSKEDYENILFHLWQIKYNS